MTGPCAKQRVVCTLHDKDGRLLARGENSCENPQPTCPREPGEDYLKCVTICRQKGHAEVMALEDLRARKIDPRKEPVHAEIRGHHHACRSCCDFLWYAGIRTLTIYMS